MIKRENQKKYITNSEKVPDKGFEAKKREEKIDFAIESLANSGNVLSPEIINFFPELAEQAGFGRGRWHKWDVPRHTAETLRIYRSFDFIPKPIIEFLQNERIDGISRNKLLELAICLHDIGKKKIYEKTKSMHGHAQFAVENQLEDVVKRFNLTQNQAMYLGELISRHHNESIEQEEILQKSLKERGVLIELMLLRLSDFMATQGKATQKDKIESRRVFTEKMLKEIVEKIIQI